MSVPILTVDTYASLPVHSLDDWVRSQWWKLSKHRLLKALYCTVLNMHYIIRLEVTLMSPNWQSSTLDDLYWTRPSSSAMQVAKDRRWEQVSTNLRNNSTTQFCLLNLSGVSHGIVVTPPTSLAGANCEPNDARFGFVCLTTLHHCLYRPDTNALLVGITWIHLVDQWIILLTTFISLWIPLLSKFEDGH